MKQNLKNMLASSFAGGGGVLLFAATMFVNISTYGFHLVVSRQVPTAEYGAVAALLGLMLIITVPATALQLVITNKVAQRRTPEMLAEGDPIPVTVGPLLRQVLLFALVAAAVVAACAKPLQSFMHLSSIVPGLMLALFILPAAFTTVPKAVLLGELRFKKVAVAFVVGSIARLVSGYVLSREYGVAGAAASSVVAETITGLIMVYDLIEFTKFRPGAIALRLKWSDASVGTLALSGFWALVTFDVLMARHFLGRDDSGIYGAAATIARSTMFLPSALALVAFPRFVEAGAGSERGRKLLLQALGATGLLAFGAAGFLIIFPQFVELLGHGNTYKASSAIVGLLGISCGFLGIIYMLIHYQMASRPKRAAAFPWIGVFGGTIAIALFHHSVHQVAIVTTTTTGLTMLLMLRDCFSLRPMNGQISIEDQVVPDTLATSDSEVMLTIVVPYLNPGSALSYQVDAIAALLEERKVTYEIIAVNDGSTDDSTEMLEALGHNALHLVSLPFNNGKGKALRVGLSQGRGRYLGFIDADGDIAAATLGAFLDIIDKYDPDIVLGSKRHPLSHVNYPIARRIYSWGYQQLTRVLFRLNVRDTQTGIKIVRRDVIQAVLPQMLVKRFAFDLELFVAAKQAGYDNFYEAPIMIRDRFSSTVSMSSAWYTFVDTCAIFYRAHILLHYEPGSAVSISDGPNRSAAASSTRQETVPAS